MKLVSDQIAKIGFRGRRRNFQRSVRVGVRFKRNLNVRGELGRRFRLRLGSFAGRFELNRRSG